MKHLYQSVQLPEKKGLRLINHFANKEYYENHKKSYTKNNFPLLSNASKSPKFEEI